MYCHDTKTVIRGIQTSLQVVWVDQEYGDDQLQNAIDNLIESYNDRVPPTKVLFVCPLGMETRIQSLFAGLDSAKDRLNSVSHILAVPYSETARVVVEQVMSIHVEEGATNWQVSDADVHGFATTAVGEILDRTATILEAPHGYLFRKPSGQEEEYFVRAGNLLRDPASLPIFSYLLLRVLPSGCSTIYIDSFTILSFALGLKSLLRYFNTYGPAVALPEIESIHSYDISSTFRMPNERSYFILISASTSNGLANKLVADKEADRRRIVHLLGVASDNDELQKSSIYFRKRTQYAKPTPHHKGVIEIGTEEFLVAQGSPRTVRISRQHVNAKAKKELCKEFYAHAMKLYEPRRSAHVMDSTLSASMANPQFGRSAFSIAMEESEQSLCPIRDWISTSLIHEIPASVSMIIYVDDNLSAWVASLLNDELEVKVDVLATRDIGAVDLPESIVLVAFQDGDLEGFERTNIALRGRGVTHCHYVLCYAFPASESEYQKRKDDLRQTSGRLRRGWSDYLVLPVGHSDLHESLILDRDRLAEENVARFRCVLGEKLMSALSDRHMSSATPGNTLFLPRVDGGCLELRPGSIFFAEADAKISQLTAYAMLSSAVQNARDRGAKGGKDIGLQFDENPFVRAVLDPSMFARFSDGVLQASLLRTTRPAELDYSASDDLSSQFAAICLSVLYGWKNEVGDAVLEFVYALATRKVSLRKADYDRLCKEISSNPILDTVYKLFAEG